MSILSLIFIISTMSTVTFLNEHRFKNKYIEDTADIITGILVILTLVIGYVNDSIFVPVTALMAIAFIRLRSIERHKQYARLHRQHLHARIEIIEEDLMKNNGELLSRLSKSNKLLEEMLKK